MTVSPLGLVKSTLAMYGEQQWFINVTWTPTQDQSGPNIFCFSAMDSIGSVTYFSNAIFRYICRCLGETNVTLFIKLQSPMIITLHYLFMVFYIFI